LTDVPGWPLLQTPARHESVTAAKMPPRHSYEYQ
jgi:hypothetical protein